MRKFFSLRHMNYLRNIAAIFSAEETKDVKNTVEDSICFPLVAIIFLATIGQCSLYGRYCISDHIRPLRERHLRPSLSCLHLLSIKCILLSSPHSGTRSSPSSPQYNCTPCLRCTSWVRDPSLNFIVLWFQKVRVLLKEASIISAIFPRVRRLRLSPSLRRMRTSLISSWLAFR